jgi:hypothetical protein
MVDVKAVEVSTGCPKLQLSSHMTHLVYAAPFKLLMSFLMGKTFVYRLHISGWLDQIPNGKQLSFHTAYM